jgi:hypothetical protein
MRAYPSHVDLCGKGQRRKGEGKVKGKRKGERKGKVKKGKVSLEKEMIFLL